MNRIKIEIATWLSVFNKSQKAVIKGTFTRQQYA